MSILTMTTDWGLRDHYLAAFKGELISRSRDIRIVDISHEIEKFNILQASFIIKNAFRKFPEGSIHFIGLEGNTQPESSSFLIVKSEGHFFIGRDSGIFSLILDNQSKEVYDLKIESSADNSIIYSRLIDILCSLSEGEQAEKLGQVADSVIQSYFARPTTDHTGIRAVVIYIDDFGNVIVNVSKELFDDQRKGRKFTIFLRKAQYNINRISNNYTDAESGEIVAFFNRDGYLEIALNRESAAGLLGIKVLENIRIEFDDNENS
ncbi:MAG: hypothetical protein DWQ44_03340 [Bacteroidetes bacterium]|nr:MAG: hypothetical protein DWQ33_04465 [Bacteroidota bacterium]REJ99968.1 MAG: hypothetical protein DWQ39_13735 [Bacteroidota bacterium]REK35852.1 MAG: hypothetical protein DWQ44_03340 [Bacteroidota bacterium]REK50671.1 MAG: hypothetical protein DWQ48_05025 [Bacteroidota bacterium]